MEDKMTISDANLDIGESLLQQPNEDVFSFMGIQAEQLDVSQLRHEKGRTVPPWSDENGVAKVLQSQRAPIDELKKYAEKGRQFAERLLESAEDKLRGILCDGSKVRDEVEALESDSRTLLMYLSTSLLGVVLTSIPNAVAGAAAAIATTLAVIQIRRNLSSFCALDA